MPRRAGPSGSRRNADLTPGTVLLREWHGIEHQVIVRDTGSSSRANSTSRCPRSRTGSPAASGRALVLRTRTAKRRSRPMASTLNSSPPLRDLHPQVHRGGAGAGVQLPRRPARGLRGLHQEPGEHEGWQLDPDRLRRRRLLRRHHGAARRCSGCWPTSARARSTSWSSTRSTG